MGIIGVVVILLLLGMMFYLGLFTTGYNNLRGITVELDELSTNTNEMAYAVYEKLKDQGKECEIIEMGEGYPKFLVDKKKYSMLPRTGSWRGFPVQIVQLRPCKN
ncbi:hypothetical protein [Clostridium vincentii]|uniref:Uncharacterized protein n=1 Tax=Clostridium vincentii TaxID=52704 RepID=A0A2T0BD83_9CLOT|nr:hypothetical protein [Clostridium vincentii]PRR81844.1 hypothetical protein CLVI_21900 [Clostridium vincentii]